VDGLANKRKANKWRFDHHTADKKAGGERASATSSGVVSSLKASTADRAAKRREKRREQRAKKRLDSTQRVALQSFLYLSSFYIAWIPWTIVTHLIVDVPNVLQDNSFWLVWTVILLQPLQGFLNCLAYFHHHCPLVPTWVLLPLLVLLQKTTRF
jgi:hypothetical protein